MSTSNTSGHLYEPRKSNLGGLRRRDTKGKVYLRIKYGAMEAYCLESVAKTLSDANEQVIAYAEALKSGSISPTERDAIKKVFNARKERMEEARAGRKAKLNAAA